MQKFDYMKFLDLRYAILNGLLIVRVAFLAEISQESGITTDDLISTLQYYGLLKYWKGKHIVIKKKVGR